MSRIFTDENLETWETYASGGKFGLPDNPKIIFHCLSDPDRRARFVLHRGDEADAEATIHQLAEGDLLGMLSGARELS